jgi:SLT domain-containing protein
MRSAWQAFLNAFKAIWDTVRAWFYNSWSVLWNIVKSAAQTVWNALKSAWQSFLNAIKSIWDTVRAWFYNSWTVLWNIVKTAAQTVWNALKAAWQTFLNAIKSIWDTVRAWFYNSWTVLWNIVRDAAVNVWNWLKSTWNSFLDTFSNIWDKFRAWFWDSWTGIWNLVKGFANKVWHEIGEIIEKAINAVITIINGLIKGFNNITSFLKIDVKVGEIDKVNFNFAEGGMVGLTPYMVGGMAEFAKGGVANLKNGGTLRGYAPGRDTVPAMLSRGEGVLTPEAVRGMGGPGFVHAANRKFAGHRGAGREARAPLSRFTGSHDAVNQRGMGKPRGFATGGIVGGVQHFAVGGMTASALQKAGVSLGLVSQGEYSNGSLSAGTHLGGGVVDLSTTSPATLAALRAAGFAAWIRGPEQGFSPHIHAVLMNHPDLSPAAAAQVKDFLAGGDGLGAGGGGGGGGIDILGMVMEHVGAILKNVYRGDNPLLNIGGAIAQFFGIGNDEDDGGLFGTGIGPDFGPNVADAVGNVVESVTGIGGQMMEMLGQVVLAALSGDGIAEGLSDAGKEFGKFGGIAGGFGKIAVGLGKKILDQVMPDFLMSKKDESTFNPADFAGGFGDVQAWAPLALQALARAGIPASQLPAFLALMQAESGGNPMAINNWDSNAIMGQASRGLMQVIPGTFAMYRDRTLPNNIFDPLANMTAAANYIRARYGGKVPGSPYALGTPGATSGVHLVGEQGPELLNFRGGETVTPAKETAGILGGGGAAPQDMLGEFELLMALAQQMSSAVQASWMKVTSAGQTAKSALTPVHQDMVNAFGTTIPQAIGTMQASNSAAWLAMQTSTDTTWATMKAGTFTEAQDHMMVKMPTWGNEMNTAVSTAWDNMGQATATAWEGMKEGTRGPTNWIIDQSYNNGIRSLWNQVAEVIFEDGAKTLPTVATLAKGGPVRGPGGETADRVPAMLSRGEHVWTAREVHRAGGHAAVQQMRQAVMGRSVRGAHGGRGFALGGWLGGVGNVSGSSPAVGTLDLKRGSMMDVVGDHLDAIDQSVKDALSGSFYRRMGGSAGVVSPTDWIRQYVEKDDELNKIGSGGPPWIPGVSDAITSWGGVTVNQRTADMLNMALALGASFSATQGSFSTGVAASAGTHDGGGVVDLVPASNTNVGALRAVGFAAWNRGAAWGSPSFSDHIHAVALGDPTVSSGAAAQVMSYLAGGNGLADGGPDNYSGGIPSVDGVSAIGGGRNVDPADLEQRAISYDRGGYLQPGYTLAFNGTGKPEPVGHHLEPKGSKSIEINMPITVNGNADAGAVVEGINRDVLPKLRQYLAKGTGNN